jgi:uncharacterized protein (TIGR03435 family)
MSVVAPILLTPPVHGQTSQARPDSPHFDVVAIRENRSAGRNAGMSLRNGSLEVSNLFLKSIITSAYGVREVLIFGLPGWAEEARYDIRARITDADPKTDDLSREQRRALMAALLEDRFHLKVHMATKTLPVYDLVVAKGGRKFSESAGERNVDARKNEFTATGSPALTVSYLLEDVLDRTVVDKTGLKGTYDFHLRWSPEMAGTPDSDALPSIFTALQEQLGLKLQPNKGPVQTLVVEHIDRPTEN